MKCWILLLFCLPLPLFGKADQKPYIIGDLMGQAGNNFFQIAATYALAWDNNAEPYFPNLHSRKITARHLFFRCREVPPSQFISCTAGGGPPLEPYTPLTFKPSMKVTGYLQSEKYFSRYRDRLLKLFAPLPKDQKYIQKQYGDLLARPNTVGVQLRYYIDDPQGAVFIQYGKDYLEKAMALFSPSSFFIISSNNIQFAKNNVPKGYKNVVFLEGEPMYIDFYILTLCKNNIITNSTFGWWSAWLNQNPSKKIVTPKMWINGYADQDICPEEWIRVDAKKGRLNDPTSY